MDNDFDGSYSQWRDDQKSIAELQQALLTTRAEVDDLKWALQRIVDEDTGKNPHIRAGVMAKVARHALEKGE